MPAFPSHGRLNMPGCLATGPTALRTHTFPDLDATLLYSGGPLGTPSSGTLTNCTLPLGGLTGLGSNVATALATALNTAGGLAPVSSPSLVTPNIGVASGTSLALGGATIGSNALAVTGTAAISGAATFGGSVTPSGTTNTLDLGTSISSAAWRSVFAATSVVSPKFQVGGVTSSFPMLDNSSTTLRARLADGSADAPFSCAALTATSGVFNGPIYANIGTTVNKLFIEANGSNGVQMGVYDSTWRDFYIDGNPVRIQVRSGGSTLVGGTLGVTGATTLAALTATTGAFSGTSGSSTPLVTLTDAGRFPLDVVSTDAGANSHYIRFYRNSASPAASDQLGAFAFEGNDAAAARRTYAYFGANIADTTAASLDGTLFFNQTINNVETDVLTFVGGAATFAGAVSCAALTATTGVHTGLLRATLTTEQFRVGYDNTTNYWTDTTNSSGQRTIAGNGTNTILTIAPSSSSGGLTLSQGNLLLSSGNATLTSGNLTLTAGSQTNTPASASGVPLTLKGAASQTGNMLSVQNSSGTPYVTIGPPTLVNEDNTSNFLRIVGALPATTATTAGANYGAVMWFTSGGSAADITQLGLQVVMDAGYTAEGYNAAIQAASAVAGVGIEVVPANSAIPVEANTAVFAYAQATTIGTNQGVVGQAHSGNINIGVNGNCTRTKNSATNIGVLGMGLNAGTSPVQIGGFFGMQASTPTFASAALMCDNGATTSDIFVARDNGTAKFRIADGGNVTAVGTITAPSFILSSPQTYNFSNVTTDRTVDANATSVDELADALGTLVADLRAAGLVL